MNESGDGGRMIPLSICSGIKCAFMRQKSIGYNLVILGTTGFHTKLNSVKPPYTSIDSCRIKTEVLKLIEILCNLCLNPPGHGSVLVFWYENVQFATFCWLTLNLYHTFPTSA